jgi:CPA1 family monovalent cation:H+ antiporter
VGQLALLFALLLGAVIMVPVGDRLRLPPPVLMTALGILLAVLPFVPNVNVPPGLILPLVLPPLLYSSVQRTSWRQFAANWRPITLLAVALVFVTTVAVASVAHALVPGLPIAAAVALGALVAPPDPVSVTAVAGSLGMPRRLVSILEGEGLFNDVTAIVIYNVAIVAAVTGSFSWPDALGQFALSAVVAVAVGIAVGWLGAKLMGLLGDATLQVGLSLLLPFASYALAGDFHGSGVLAVLVTALFLTESWLDADDIEGRLTSAAFWQIVETLVTGVAFGLIGLELHNVFGSAGGRLGQMLAWGGIVAGVVVVVRLAWLLPASWLTRFRRRLKHSDMEVPVGWRETVVMWWSGMRGVASIALALAVPLTVQSGLPFPARNVIVFVAFAVVLSTLVVQGLTLPWLVNRLGVRADTAAERDLERDLATRATKAARRRLREITQTEDLPDELVEMLARRLINVGMRISPDILDEERREAYAARADRVKTARRVQSEMMSAARRAVLSARSEPGADPEIVDRVLRQLDVGSIR